MSRSTTSLIAVSILLLATLAQPLLQPQNVDAVTASDWQAGNIISDSVFTNTSAMTVSQIQAWLDTRLANCDYYGTKPSELSGGIDYDKNGVVTRAEYGRTMGNPAPFTCLNDYYEVPKTTPSSTVPVNNYGTSTIPSGAKSAAQLIYDAAQAYNISPKVLLVKLGTESAGPLTSDPWPFERQYLYAMGAHCPDSGPGGSANCDTNYSGFSLQIREAAKLLRWYLDSMPQSWWPYKKPYATNYILWNVEPTGCGGSNVYIKSKATAALYTYTPYQPNAAALNNLYGTGDGCSAYGNRNFWRMFTDWFGNTQAGLKFETMVQPRYMRVKSSTQKVNLVDSTIKGTALAQNQEIYFSSKITVSGITYLRTKHDSDRGNNFGIRLSELEDISLPANYKPMMTPRWMILNKDTFKYNPVTQSQSGPVLAKGTLIYLGEKFDISDKTYLRTQHDINSNTHNLGINIRDFDSVSLTREPFSKPRWLVAKRTLTAYDFAERMNIGLTIEKGSHYYFDSKLDINGLTVISRTSAITASRAYSGFNLLDFEEIRLEPKPLLHPRSMILTEASETIDPITGLVTGPHLPRELELEVTDKITVGDEEYFSLMMDGRRIYVPNKVFAEKYKPMMKPGHYLTTTDLQALNPTTGQSDNQIIPRGTRIFFDTKVDIGSKVFLRSKDSSDANLNLVIPLRLLVAD